MSPISEQCPFCVHLHPTGVKPTCDAFPEGIPKDILAGVFDHTNPYPNEVEPKDNGVRFERK